MAQPRRSSYRWASSWPPTADASEVVGRFFLTRQRSLDAPRMYDQAKALLNEPGQLGRAQTWFTQHRLLEDRHDVRAQLVCATRAWTLWQEPRQAILAKRVLSVVEGHPREAEAGGGVRD